LDAARGVALIRSEAEHFDKHEEEAAAYVEERGLTASRHAAPVIVFSDNE
jgi:hypothetical protein